MLINIRHADERVDFRTAVLHPLGRDKGLYMPEYLRPMHGIQALLDQPFVPRSAAILTHLLDGAFTAEQVQEMVETAFSFDAPLVPIEDRLFALELFHGPTLAFKDFGARFMAQCIQASRPDAGITILTATSGDTGAAVAHAFYRLPGIEVKILYPRNKISLLQEKLFCSLGENIQTFAVDGDFDDCQRLVKGAFDDAEISRRLNLNSANSINIARLFAQVCYYFELCARLQHTRPVVAVPSGNFGNLTAGLLAARLGAPIRRFIAATNLNDTVPRFLLEGRWQPQPTQETASNAMDVSAPNNWPRVMHLFNNDRAAVLNCVRGARKTDEETFTEMRQLARSGYLAEPHGAVACAALRDHLKGDETGVFLATAHPAKFIETVQDVLAREIEIPEALRRCADAPLLSRRVTNDLSAFRQILLK